MPLIYRLITTNLHLLAMKCIYLNNAVLLGIYVNNDTIPYIKSLRKLKFTNRNHGSNIYKNDFFLEEGFNKDNEYYLKCMNSETVPTHFINYESFFINQEVAEYIKLCDFLNIPPDVEMYKKAIDCYMYMNNKLLKDGEFEISA